jgi:hypothetical protein
MRRRDQGRAVDDQSASRNRKFESTLLLRRVRCELGGSGPKPASGRVYDLEEAVRAAPMFCSFLALMLQKELADLCQAHALVIEWADLLRDLDRLQEATIERDGKAITTRTAVAGQVGSVLQAAGVALPPNLRQHAV